ncbi:MAG: hypothetical protein V3R86_05550 [Candidatus Hydrothermarchaeaceae archaeon]
MKKTLLIVIGLAALLVFAGCTQVQQQKTQEGSEEPFEKIPIIDAYYEGEKIWFIHPDVTDPGIAERLTKMTNYRTLYAPKNAEAVDIGKLAKFYVFTNGIDHRGTLPWGGGPFGFQIDIFDSIPGNEGYTSLRTPHLVTWNEGARPRILKSVKVLLEAEARGELNIEETGAIVNAPIVRWPGGGARLN